MSRPVKRPRKFHVHVYPIVRIRVSDIVASSYRDAIEKAIDRLPPDVLYRRFETGDSEYAEEFSHFLVDVAGDKEFLRSQWYQSSQESLIPLLQKLVDWHRQPHLHSPQLDSIVAEARKALRTTV